MIPFRFYSLRRSFIAIAMLAAMSVGSSITVGQVPSADPPSDASQRQSGRRTEVPVKANEKIDARSAESAAGVNQPHQAQLMRWVKKKVENTASLHRLAMESTSDPGVKAFARDSHDVLQSAALDLEQEAVGVESVSREGGSDAGTSPDLSDTVSEIANAIQARSDEAGAGRDSGLSRESQSERSTSAAQLPRSDSNRGGDPQRRVAVQDGAPTRNIQSSEDERSRPGLEMLRENLPLILQLVTEAIEDDGGKTAWVSLHSEIADREIERIQDEMNQYEGATFDRMYLTAAMISESNLMAVFETLQGKNNVMDTQALSDIQDHLSEDRGRIRELLRGVVDQEAKNEGASASRRNTNDRN